jgi:hypothetical protein
MRESALYRRCFCKTDPFSDQDRWVQTNERKLLSELRNRHIQPLPIDECSEADWLLRLVGI